MIKKLFYLFLLLIPFVGNSQISVGDWKIHALFGSDPTNIIDTPNKVYYLVSNNLFVYDKADQVNESLTKRNKLSDNLIRNIYYNYDNKYLLIAYDNSNIDFLYDNGKVVNLPDLRDVILSTAKGINGVCFSDNKVYVATDFGYMIVNDKKQEVSESRIFNTKINAIATTKNKLILSDANNIYVGNKNDAHISLSTFTPTAISGINMMMLLNDTKLMLRTGWLYSANINDDNSVTDLNTINNVGCYLMQPSGNLFLIQPKDGTLTFYDAQGNQTKKITLPSNLSSSLFSSYSGSDYWVMDANGVKNIKLSDDGAETVLADYFKPDASTVSRPYTMAFNESLGKLYVTDRGSDIYLKEYWLETPINTLTGSTWKDISPALPTQNPSANNPGKVNAPYQLIFDPDDPNTYYFGTWFDGVFKITNDKCVANYNWLNSPLKLNWACITPGVQFDKNKNLWIVEGDVANVTAVLPRAKQSQDNLTANDWKTVTVRNFNPKKSAHFIITKKNDIKIFTDGVWGSTLIFLNDNSTIDIASDDQTQSYSSLIDQDEKSYEWNYINCFIEDKNGKVWMGTSNGVIEMDPSRAFNTNFRINHLKVPRNDGTAYADYLLENENVLCMAVDGANRKWIGTESSGLFLVSADGSQILKKFTTENSYLPSNRIMALACNSSTNSVYIGTSYGVVEYSSDASVAEADFSNVYAYPNPVRPGYTGWITIRGLMDNTLVKITDATGTVVNSGLSTGGMYTWDGCNGKGERVKTGVYYVLVSQNENEKSSGAVTKILVVN